MRRVLIIGPCGAGKSTLAAQMGERLGLPIFHMDQLNWRSGWVESTHAELTARLAEVTAGDEWIIDGTYGGTLAERLQRADTVVYLDFPIRLCMTRLLRRIWTYRGTSRPDMPDGCPERFDLAFLLYVMRWNSGPKLRCEARLEGHFDKVVRLRSPKLLRQWLADLPERQTQDDQKATNAVLRDLDANSGRIAK